MSGVFSFLVNNKEIIQITRMGIIDDVTWQINTFKYKFLLVISGGCQYGHIQIVGLVIIIYQV